jgi:thiol-disulfide isomerase/thioredoxin
MKHYFILLTVLILTTINASGQNDKQFKFEIDGTINADTGKIYLSFFTGYTSNKSAELVTQVKNNKFSFSGFITEPQGVYINFGDNYMSSDFIIEKGLQTITINTDSTEKVPVVSNSTMQNEYPLYSAFFKQHTAKRNRCEQKYDSLNKLNNYTWPEAIKTSYLKELAILYKEHDKLLLNYTEKHPDSKIAFWRLVRLMGWGYEPIFDSICNSFSDDLKNGYAGKVLATKLMEGKVLTVGEYFPLLPCADLNNKPFTLELFKDNRYTLVDFWYIRCGPCRAQFDKLKDLYSQFSTKGFEIVAISKDQESDKKNYEDAIKTEKLTWKHYWDVNGKETRKLSINSFPTNFLIDNLGEIIAKNISLGELEQLLSKNL